MIYDPATQTFNGSPEQPQSFLEQEYQGCMTAIGIILIAPILVMAKCCEKYNNWQDGRFVELQDAVLKQKPFAVLVRENGGRGTFEADEDMVRRHAYQTLFTQAGRNNWNEDCQMEFVKPTLLASVQA